MPHDSAVDFEALFAATPGPYLILSPALTIIAVNDAYLRATMTRRDGMIGRPMFEVFPDNPADPTADGVANLRASLERVLRLKQPDKMAVQKYDIRRPDDEGGGFIVRHWNPLNIPVFDRTGEVACIIHHVEDVTRIEELEAADERSREAAARQQALISQLRAANRQLAQQIESNARLARAGRQTSEALEAEEKRFRAVANKLPGIVYRGISMPDGSYSESYVSEGLHEALGVAPEYITSGAARILDYIHESEREAKLALFVYARDNLEPISTDLRMVRPDGAERWWRLHSSPTRLPHGPIQWDGIALDVTERRQVERQLQQAVKMEAIGQLTGGLAHDFNNLLTVILGNAETLVDELDGDASLRVLAQLTQTAAQRGAELTSQLLAFARRQALEPKAIDVNKLVAGMDGLLRRTLVGGIDIELVRGAGLWKAMADPAQLESAILNLAVNARDAMPGGGKLTLETGNMHIDDTYAGVHDEVTPGRYVLVSVTDTGSGMSAETIARAFDPFFTTKEVGKGTGLGLSMVFGFVKQSGGHVKIYSEPGYGTTIKMYLPRAYGGEVEADDRSIAAPEPVGSETVLLVEDTEILRRHVETMLKSLGYRVIAAASGPEAMEVVRSAAPIDLLFTDIVMAGGMNGRQLAEEALKLRPMLKVLYTSGYTENAIVHQGRLDPGVQLLRKPYGKRELASKLRFVLDGAQAAD
jgi:PAS domain S-box-containing protein